MSIKLDANPSYQKDQIAKILRAVADWVEASSNGRVYIVMELRLGD